MKNSILLALFGIAVISAVPARANTASFDFTQGTTGSNFYGLAQTEAGTAGSQYSNTSNSFSQTVMGIKVTATAYATTTNNGAAGTAISGANTNAEVGQYDGNGIGVCSAAEDSENGGWTPGSACNSPYHEVNDDGDYEFVLFTFQTPVNLSTITLANFGGGSLGALGVAIWVDPSLTSIPASTSANFIECATYSDCPTAQGNSGGIGVGSWTTPNLNLTDVTTLLVGSDTRDTNDFFKIQGLGGVTNFATATPEPATFGLLGLSLAGFGLLRRKRKLN